MDIECISNSIAQKISVLLNRYREIGWFTIVIACCIYSVSKTYCEAELFH